MDAAFGELMGEGWKKGVLFKFRTEKVVAKTSWKVYKNNKTNDEGGDIDFLFAFNDKREFLLHDILPDCNKQIRPTKIAQRLNHESFPAVMAEIKRSLGDSDRLANKVNQFVNFYFDLLSGGFKIGARNVEEIVSNERAKLLFVFNGEDSSKVEKQMRDSIRAVTGEKLGEAMSICGREVICLWIDSSDLIKW